jgi:hypothetical protein
MSKDSNDSEWQCSWLIYWTSSILPAFKATTCRKLALVPSSRAYILQAQDWRLEIPSSGNVNNTVFETLWWQWKKSMIYVLKINNAADIKKFNVLQTFKSTELQNLVWRHHFQSSWNEIYVSHKYTSIQMRYAESQRINFENTLYPTRL